MLIARLFQKENNARDARDARDARKQDFFYSVFSAFSVFSVFFYLSESETFIVYLCQSFCKIHYIPF
ncbi:MAG: hypothetical protein DRR16_07255 [Candidatus Parabeggiatoa sp. nov. 3]|nr:MAG: hypothetical protein DRR00_00200 [Gammaproteobacteria bacterium]RKZ69563.1 MAG: hypothetical protein DRQ99_00585 [Gammaproteobacteria bacterium]RKZ87464.1 MAG: hypothetical protein DRR16_07255 [Gammaproteobacteria bacterium]